MNHREMDPDVVEELRKEAVKHLRFVICLHKIQLDDGRYFLHEHPNGTTSWDAQCMRMFLSHPQVRKVRGDMCPHGMMSEDEEGVGKVFKPTG